MDITNNIINHTNDDIKSDYFPKEDLLPDVTIPDVTTNRKLAGASVLPYSCDPSHNNIYFLLGAEKRLPRWVDSNKWADFGGSPKQNEDDADLEGSAPALAKTGRSFE